MKSKKRKIVFLLVFGAILIFSISNLSAQSKDLKCQDWKLMVDPKSPLNLAGIENKTQEEIYYGINCLLQLKGKKYDSNIAGATRPDVSQRFGATSVEVAALYYISYLFYQEWDHANAPFLKDKKGKLNTIASIDKAYKSYRLWFNKVKKLGLEDARKQKLNPLADSGVSWY